MTIEVPESLEAALKVQAQVRGVSPDDYVREVLERDLGGTPKDEANRPFKTSFGILAKYGTAPSAEEIDANRAEMFRNFGEEL